MTGQPYLVHFDCPRCDGTGGPDPIFDEDTGRWVASVCSSCSGSGTARRWSDECPECSECDGKHLNGCQT